MARPKKVHHFKIQTFQNATGSTSWRVTGTKADGTPLDERGVLVMGISDDRIAWGRLYVDEVEREGAAIDAAVRRMAGTDET